MTNYNIKVDATVSFLNVIRGEKTTVSHNSNENFSLFDFWCYDFADADVDISTICNEYNPIVLPSKKVVNDVSSLKYVNMVSISVAALYHYNDFEEFTNLLNIQVSTDVGYGVYDVSVGGVHIGTLKSKADFLDSDTNEHILKMLLLDADHYVYNRNVFFNYFGDSQVLSKLNVSFKNNILDIIQQ